MKEHRTRTLRVTTPGNIASREREDTSDHGHEAPDEPLWAVQLLRLQLACAAPSSAAPGSAAPGTAPAPIPTGCASGFGLAYLAGDYEKGTQDRRRPACSICGPTNGLPQKRRSPTSLRRTAVDTPTLAPCEDREPDVGDGGSAGPGRCGGCAGPPGSCPQPLLHLFSGDLDRCWADVVLALRLLVRVAAEAGDSPGTVSVNGVTVGVAGGRVQVRVCGREADAFATSLQCWVTGRDAAGHTALLLAGRRLLSAGRWADAALVASLLLDAGSDANAVNRDGRSLLSYAVAALDDAAETSRLLLNHGASVLGVGPLDAVPPTLRPTLTPGGGAEPCPSSPVFAWFLRAVIRRRRLDEGCLRTLALVSQEMAEQMGPRRMHGLVLRTMFRHSRCYRVLGPVFLQIKTAMARHWSTPQDLRSLCRCVIRRALGVPSAHGPAAGGARLPLHQSVCALGLPRPLQEYLLLYA